jgi:hypothetical protein
MQPLDQMLNIGLRVLWMHQSRDRAFIKALPVGTPMLIRDTRVTGLMLAVKTHSKSYKVRRDL